MMTYLRCSDDSLRGQLVSEIEHGMVPVPGSSTSKAGKSPYILYSVGAT